SSSLNSSTKIRRFTPFAFRNPVKQLPINPAAPVTTICMLDKSMESMIFDLKPMQPRLVFHTFNALRFFAFFRVFLLHLPKPEGNQFLNTLIFDGGEI